MKNKTLSILFYSNILVIGLFVFLAVNNIYINTSKSLDYFIYQKQDDNFIKKGDVVLVCLNNIQGDFALKHGIINMGKCHNKFAPIGKHVIAKYGDLVSINQQGIFVNNTLINKSKPLDNLRSVKIFEQNIYNYYLKKNEYLVFNPKELSFDSRYLGIIKKGMIIGKIQKSMWVKLTYLFNN